MKLLIDGMSCGHCANSVTKAIQSLKPDTLVNVDLASKQVTITGDITLDQAIAAITAAGFDYLGMAE